MFGIWYLVFMSLLKIISNILGTVRIILTQKNQAILASVLLVFCCIIDYITTKVAVSADMLTIVILSIACGIGCYVAMIYSDHHSRDRTYVNVIMNDNEDAMFDFYVFLIKNDIVAIAADCYTKDMTRKTLSITAYAETKAQSRLIDEYIENSPLKFKRKVQEVA